jgi:hypothetical protein
MRDEDGIKMDATYYYGKPGGKRMKRMKRRELYARLAEAYQLAGSFLIGAKVIEFEAGRKRMMNGWTQKEMNLAIETLLDFLSRPYSVDKAKFDKARQIYREWPKE